MRLFPKPYDLCETCGHCFYRHNYSDSRLPVEGDPLGHMYECLGELILGTNEIRCMTKCSRFVPHDTVPEHAPANKTPVHDTVWRFINDLASGTYQGYGVTHIIQTQAKAILEEITNELPSEYAFRKDNADE